MITSEQREEYDTAAAMLAIAADLDRQARDMNAKAQAIRAMYAPKRRPFKRRNLVDLVKSQKGNR